MALESVDWNALPKPESDGAADHLKGMHLPDVTLPGTHGSEVALSSLTGLSVIYAYPMTGRPDVALPEGWDRIPGARGCTPQSCAFRDHFQELKDLGASHLFGLSVQATDYQREAAERLHLPFPLLSDKDYLLADALRLPTMEVEGRRLLKRLTMIVRDSEIVQVNYPVFPPDRDAPEVIAWLQRFGTQGE